MTDSDSRSPAQRLSRRDFLVGATLAGASAVGYAAQPKVVNPRIVERNFESWIPQTFGRWSLVGSSGLVLPPPDALKDRLYDNVVTRVYQGPYSAPVMMLIAYNYRQDGVLQLHRPEFCYPAGGYSLSPALPVTLDLGPSLRIPATAFTADGDSQIEQILYFTRVGNSFPRTWAEQRMSVVGANLRGQIPDGVLMRVSMRDPDKERSLAVLREFLEAFFANTPRPLHRVLIGVVD